MLIGFAPEAPEITGAMTDAELLSELGCERIFSEAQGIFVVDDVIGYLRPGDVLVVARLEHLKTNIVELIYLVERLHQAGVGLQVAATEIAPGTTAGDSFPKLCVILAEFCRTTAAQSSERATRIRARGRPVALTPAAQKQAERMLKGGRTSVSEIARVFNVSPATVYRYFPRRGREAKLLTTEKTSPAAASEKRPARNKTR